MLIKLHANAVLTPAKRAYVQSSSASVAELARELGVGEGAIRRWKGRSSTADRSSRPHRLQTRFTLDEEAIVRELRTELGLSLDDLLEVMRRCVRPDISRSALHRCLQRLDLPAPPPDPKPDTQRFAAEPFGYVHIDLKHLTRLQGRPAYVFVAIERTTRFVHAEIIDDRSATTVAACLERFLDAFAQPVHTILTDNGAEFTDRFGDARWRTTPRTKGTGTHPFDRVCADHGIRHKLTRPFRPQTNGMVERFNRRIRDAIAAQPPAGNNGKNRFATHAERNSFLITFVQNYNRTRLRCLNHKAPAEVLANLQGHNTKAGTQTGACAGSRPSPG